MGLMTHEIFVHTIPIRNTRDDKNMLKKVVGYSV